MDKKILLSVILILIFISCKKQDVNEDIMFTKDNNSDLKQQVDCSKIKEDFKNEITPILEKVIKALFEKNYNLEEYFINEFSIDITTPDKIEREPIYSKDFTVDTLRIELNNKNSFLYKCLFGIEDFGYILNKSSSFEYIINDCVSSTKSFRDLNGILLIKYNNKYSRRFIFDGKVKKIIGIYMILPEEYFKEFDMLK